jgi:hypothetical protein
MKRFIEGEDRNQSTLFPKCLEDYIAEDNPVRVIDVFVDELDLGQLGFGRVEPKDEYRCPADEHLIWRMTSKENGLLTVIDNEFHIFEGHVDMPNIRAFIG